MGNKTSLLSACAKEKWQMASELIATGCEVDVHQEFTKRAPLHYAAQSGNVEIVKLLLEHGAMVDILDAENKTPLHCAAISVAPLLLAARANLSAEDKDGSTPLHTAAEDGRTEVMQLFLERGIPVDLRSREEWTSLHFAAVNGHLPCVKLLLDRGAQVDAREREMQRTPLHFAAGNGHTETASYLIDRGTPVDVINRAGWSPLHMACMNGHAATTALLLQRGADPGLQNGYGWAALHFASSTNRVEVVAQLLSHNVSLETVNKEGNTALHLACSQGHLQASALLLDKHANPNARNRDRKTPLELVPLHKNEPDLKCPGSFGCLQPTSFFGAGPRASPMIQSIRQDLAVYLSSVFEREDPDSDIELIAFGRTFHLHRIILKRSEYFRTALTGKEAGKQFELRPEEEHPFITPDGFVSALRYLYSDQPPPEPQVFIPFLAACQMLQLPNPLEIPQFRELFLVNLPQYWLAASQFSLMCEPCKKIVVSWMETNLYDLYHADDPNVYEIPFEIFDEVLRNWKFWCPTEFDVYLLIRSFFVETRRRRAVAQKAQPPPESHTPQPQTDGSTPPPLGSTRASHLDFDTASVHSATPFEHAQSGMMTTGGPIPTPASMIGGVESKIDYAPDIGEARLDPADNIVPKDSYNLQIMVGCSLGGPSTPHVHNLSRLLQSGYHPLVRSSHPTRTRTVTFFITIIRISHEYDTDPGHHYIIHTDLTHLTYEIHGTACGHHPSTALPAPLRALVSERELDPRERALLKIIALAGMNASQLATIVHDGLFSREFLVKAFVDLRRLVEGTGGHPVNMGMMGIKQVR
ncbi:putative serine/threonine-protein phosphatase 6 regulatory ankyrin repeat subunit B [Paratrimastix pyriformis]|uniref:Serine/threonine-protein phosphatase 6 regulatory ankyrin repeat subunit B n=1 Tax=Paratrimastix pyriformis TaxID=342808 RepID=A0ABQ8UNZ6_9EUKA|nr:putative serine/threonine-protein phosphatase 6 regulatory ankyrin repeat subunit B [Paratrimastix pyriformis]